MRAALSNESAAPNEPEKPMHTNAPWETQHQAFLQHLMSGRCCHAPTGRYCSAGEALRQAYVEAFVESLDIEELEA